MQQASDCPGTKSRACRNVEAMQQIRDVLAMHSITYHWPMHEFYVFYILCTQTIQNIHNYIYYKLKKKKKKKMHSNMCITAILTAYIQTSIRAVHKVRHAFF